MTSRTLSFKAFVLVAVMAVFATVAVASPVTIPPLPTTTPNLVASSPVTIPPLPTTTPGKSRMVASSPVTIPPLPTTTPGKSHLTA